MKLTVREMQASDMALIVNYFVNAKPDFLLGMGVDTNKLPDREEWIDILHREQHKKYEEKAFYYIIWEVNGEPVGHSNINKIVFGEKAYMHMHVWKEQKRKKGMGLQFVRMTLPCYFNKFQLKKLFCEPYALNPAPNKILIKAEFKFMRQYETTPGWINFRQKVNRYIMTKERFKMLNNPNTHI